MKSTKKILNKVIDSSQLKYISAGHGGGAIVVISNKVQTDEAKCRQDNVFISTP